MTAGTQVRVYLTLGTLLPDQTVRTNGTKPGWRPVQTRGVFVVSWEAADDDVQACALLTHGFMVY